ncbi:hypothetical protein SAMN04487962_102260 [Marinobacter segnicrescens]|uniref:DUF6285 domain-containing protein n=1 Tax=Marinobacter segnicrescens TaxID=430453 RepID=A0A1I0A8T6_9GAMM|nr:MULTISPECIES: DUF6285 domain-containing protein [Marinobacter]UZD66073.1 DUF6285 domain-containing protein [Marinobacter sp. AN1]SES90553.1 hypothetical protein SAMN04487962_102260 [Marinobacter segnicrescens]
MQDLPDNTALLASVEAFLKDEVMPQLDAAGAFRARVSTNVLGMVRRHLEQAGRDGVHDERELLTQLIGKKGTLAGQTAELCQLIASGNLTPDDPRLRDYLWLTTLAKVGVDQPKYSGYRRAREEWAAFRAATPAQHPHL